MDFNVLTFILKGIFLIRVQERSYTCNKLGHLNSDWLMFQLKAALLTFIVETQWQVCLTVVHCYFLPHPFSLRL